MRRVEQLDISYSTDESRCSVFAGICKSQELFEQYWEKDYDLLEDDYMKWVLILVSIPMMKILPLWYCRRI